MERNIFNSCKDLKSLKSMYRELVKRYHPDCGGSNANFQDITTLYLKRKTRLMAGLQFSNMRNGVAI